VKCQICGNPATFRVYETVKNKKRALHLCEKCARERNLIPEPPGPQLDLKALLNLLMQPFPPSGEPAEEATPVAAGVVCAVCGLTITEFKATGRLGCQHDYAALRQALEPLIERIHRSVTHEGKVPRELRVREWKQQMQKAVELEDYEEAVRLRDLIRKAEK
jgi:protein arginine kinase activator